MTWSWRGWGWGAGKPTRRGRGAQIRPGETAAAWDPRGTLMEAVGVDGGGFGEGGGAQCHRGCRRRDSASWRKEASGDRSTDQRRDPVTRRPRPSRLARRDADELRDCGGTLAAQSEGEKRREGVARSAWRRFLSSRSAGARLPNG